MGPSSASSEWESSEEEMEEEGEQSAMEESKIPEEEKNQAAPRELVPHGQQSLEDRRLAKEQAKSHEKKNGDGQSLALEDSGEMEFEERKAGQPAEENKSRPHSKSSKRKGSSRSKKRAKKASQHKMSRTAVVGAAQGRQEAGDSEILVAERAGEENKNRSQHIVQQANDGSVGASGSVASVIKRKEKSKNQEDFDSKLMVRGEVPSI